MRLPVSFFVPASARTLSSNRSRCPVLLNHTVERRYAKHVIRPYGRSRVEPVGPHPRCARKEAQSQGLRNLAEAHALSRLVGRTLYVRIPTADFDFIGEKYGQLIEEAIEKLDFEIDSVVFETPAQDPAAPRVREDGGFAPVPSHSASAPRTSNGSKPAQAAPAGREQAAFDWHSASQLNPRYQFDGFVAGPGNQFALASAHRPLQSALPRPTTRSSSTAASAWARRI